MGSPFTTPLARARQAWQAFNTQPRLLQAAYLLSAIPLLVGTWIFFRWLITRQEWLQVAGFITICLGLVAVFSAFICLKMHNDLQWDDTPEKARRIRRNTWLVRTLMVSNFVLALVYMEAAFHAGSGYKVVIINETAKTIDRLTLNSQVISSNWARWHPANKFHKPSVASGIPPTPSRPAKATNRF